ncbi:MAG: HEAT repeat domain-containing protein, partial [Planctomycetota bacterium]
AESAAALDAKPVESLMGDLANPSSDVRARVAAALGRKKLEAASAVVAALGHPDWRVRRGACDAIRAMVPRGKAKEPDAAERELREAIEGAIPALIELLSDKELWVRAGAASALGAMGKQAAPAADALVRACGDDDPWVREAAIPAVRAVTEDKEARRRAALGALMKRSTGFADMRHA